MTAINILTVTALALLCVERLLHISQMLLS